MGRFYGVTVIFDPSSLLAVINVNLNAIFMSQVRYLAREILLIELIATLFAIRY